MKSNSEEAVHALDVQTIPEKPKKNQTIQQVYIIFFYGH